MKELLLSMLRLKERGYVDIECHDGFIVAKKKENGKYYLFDNNLEEYQGSESDQIKVVEKDCIYLIQEGSVNTISWRTFEYPF